MARDAYTTFEKVWFILELMEQDLELLEGTLSGEDAEVVGQLMAYADEAKRQINSHQQRSVMRARAKQSGPTGPPRAARSVRPGR